MSGLNKYVAGALMALSLITVPLSVPADYFFHYIEIIPIYKANNPLYFRTVMDKATEGKYTYLDILYCDNGQTIDRVEYESHGTGLAAARTLREQHIYTSLPWPFPYHLGGEIHHCTLNSQITFYWLGFLPKIQTLETRFDTRTPSWLPIPEEGGLQ